MTVRVRFAPSPTGALHIGSARTALYNFLFARHEKGTLLLRVEDTDRARSTKESLDTILDGLRWLGLAWDEGPYYQSERLPAHRAAAERLLAEGRAYWREDPEKGRALVFAIDRGRIEWDDGVHGRIGREMADDPDLVILKSDGSPTYNFACVVDDRDMGITHVIRGDDHIMNTPKQISLYRALGADPPAFSHIPLILDPSGAKISKRREYPFPVTIEETRQRGYLPEAFVNFLALLGWSPGNDVEVMTLEEMISAFTLDRVNTSGARFLADKLEWMNGQYIRALPPDRLVDLCRPRLQERYDLAGFDGGTIREAVLQQQGRIKRLDEISEKTRFVFASEISYDEKAVEKWVRAEGASSILRDLREGLASLPNFEREPVENLLKALAEKYGVKLNRVAQPLRVAVTGTDASPAMHETLGVLGKARALARLDSILAGDAR